MAKDSLQRNREPWVCGLKHRSVCQEVPIAASAGGSGFRVASTVPLRKGRRKMENGPEEAAKGHLRVLTYSRWGCTHPVQGTLELGSNIRHLPDV